MKKIFIIFIISVLALSCKEQKSDFEAGTLTIDFQAIIGQTDNNAISDNSYLKITGAYGDIDAKIDAATGASAPSGIPSLLNKYRSVDNNIFDNKIEVGMGQFLLFGAANAARYIDDGMSGSGIAQRTVDGKTGPKITGTGITKDDDGVITIKFAHAGGKNVDPYLFEMKSDSNGIFKIGEGGENFKRSESAIIDDTDFNNTDILIIDKPEASPYWKGDLQAVYENNIIKITGTLTETK